MEVQFANLMECKQVNSDTYATIMVFWKPLLSPLVWELRMPRNMT